MSRKLQRGFFRLALGFFLWLCVLSLLPKTSFAECGDCGPDFPGRSCDTCCPVGDNTCTQSCNQIAEKCSWTNHNSCQPDQWGPWGICNDHCQVRYCEPPGDTRDMELRSCGGGTCGKVPGCFLPGTIVNSSDGGKKIEDVQVGDKVDSFADNLITKSKVSKIYKVTRDYYYSLVAGDYQVKVTAEHPFFVGNNKFKEVKDLKAGDDVYVMEGKSLAKKTVTSNTRINEKTDAYNLSVDNTQTFFANGFAVHNKGVPSYGLFAEISLPNPKYGKFMSKWQNCLYMGAYLWAKLAILPLIAYICALANNG